MWNLRDEIYQQAEEISYTQPMEFSEPPFSLEMECVYQFPKLMFAVFCLSPVILASHSKVCWARSASRSDTAQLWGTSSTVLLPIAWESGRP